MAEFAHNNRQQHSSTRRSLFLANLRKHLKIYKVEKALKKTNEMIKWRIDKSRGDAIKYKEGDII